MILASPIFWGFLLGVTFTAVCSDFSTASWRIPNPATHFLASAGLRNCAAEPYGSLKPSSFRACSISTMCALPQSPSAGLEQSLVCLDCGCLCFLVLTLGSYSSRWELLRNREPLQWSCEFSSFLSNAIVFSEDGAFDGLDLVLKILFFLPRWREPGCLQLPSLFISCWYFASVCALLIQNFKAVYIFAHQTPHFFKVFLLHLFLTLTVDLEKSGEQKPLHNMNVTWSRNFLH